MRGPSLERQFLRNTNGHLVHGADIVDAGPLLAWEVGTIVLERAVIERVFAVGNWRCNDHVGVDHRRKQTASGRRCEQAFGEHRDEGMDASWELRGSAVVSLVRLVDSTVSSWSVEALCKEQAAAGMSKTIHHQTRKFRSRSSGCFSRNMSQNDSATRSIPFRPRHPKKFRGSPIHTASKTVRQISEGESGSKKVSQRRFVE